MAEDLEKIFQQHSKELHGVLEDTSAFHQQVLAVAEHLQEAFIKGHKVFIAGNGGSAAQAQHFSDEMVGRYKKDRRPYPVVALTADGAVLTCIGNDFGFEHVFRRQVEALGTEGDIFIGLTTSGASPNILAAAEQARSQGMTVVALTGLKGTFGDMADLTIIVPSETSARVQELHLHAIHLMCEAFESGVVVNTDLAKANGTS